MKGIKKILFHKWDYIKKRRIHSLAEGVSAWTGGVEGINEGKKKERRDRSVWRGERCVGRFSQLPTLLWILRFKGLVFFLALEDTRRGKKTMWWANGENLWAEISNPNNLSVFVFVIEFANVFQKIPPWSYVTFKGCLASLYLFFKNKYNSSAAPGTSRPFSYESCVILYIVMSNLCSPQMVENTVWYKNTRRVSERMHITVK